MGRVRYGTRGRPVLVIPNVHPANRSTNGGGGYPLSAVGQAGFDMTDTSCPINADTYTSTYFGDH